MNAFPLFISKVWGINVPKSKLLQKTLHMPNKFSTCGANFCLWPERINFIIWTHLFTLFTPVFFLFIQILFSTTIILYKGELKSPGLLDSHQSLIKSVNYILKLQRYKFWRCTLFHSQSLRIIGLTFNLTTWIRLFNHLL